MKSNAGEIKTLGYVLKRTNYGEADRILNLITPVGKISAIAKGVRREKSKLAGGVEMFTLTELNIHKGRGEMGTVTGAKMLKYYSNILKDLARMELAAMILKKVSTAAEGQETAEYFRIVDESLAELNDGAKLELVEAWFWLNLLKTMGEEVNLYRDESGGKLSADEKYNWNVMEKVFYVDGGGEFGAEEIKLMRLMVGTNLKIVRRVKNLELMLVKILNLTRTVVK